MLQTKSNVSTALLKARLAVRLGEATDEQRAIVAEAEAAKKAAKKAATRGAACRRREVAEATKQWQEQNAEEIDRVQRQNYGENFEYVAGGNNRRAGIRFYTINSNGEKVYS